MIWCLEEMIFWIEGNDILVEGIDFFGFQIDK